MKTIEELEEIIHERDIEIEQLLNEIDDLREIVAEFGCLE